MNFNEYYARREVLGLRLYLAEKRLMQYVTPGTEVLVRDRGHQHFGSASYFAWARFNEHVEVLNRVPYRDGFIEDEELILRVAEGGWVVAKRAVGIDDDSVVDSYWSNKKEKEALEKAVEELRLAQAKLEVQYDEMCKANEKKEQMDLLLQVQGEALEIHQRREAALAQFWARQAKKEKEMGYNRH